MRLPSRLPSGLVLEAAVMTDSRRTGSSGAVQERDGPRAGCVVIPADARMAVEHRLLRTGNLDGPEQVVNGFVQILGLDNPSARLYVNEDGQAGKLPVNTRATMLLWMHNRSARFRGIVAGDAVLGGRDGTDVPTAYIRQFFTARQFRVEVQAYGDPDRHVRDERFEEWTDACSFALSEAYGTGSLYRHEVTDMRVVPVQ